MKTYKNVLLGLLGMAAVSCGSLKGDKKEAFDKGMSEAMKEKNLTTVEVVFSGYQTLNEKAASVIAVDQNGDYHRVTYGGRSKTMRLSDCKIPDFEIPVLKNATPLSASEKGAFNAAATKAFAAKGYTIEKEVLEPCQMRRTKVGGYLIKGEDNLYRIGEVCVTKKDTIARQTAYPVNPARY